MKRIIRGLLHKLDRMLEDKKVYSISFLCIKDIPDDDGNLSFTEGKTYKAAPRGDYFVYCNNKNVGCVILGDEKKYFVRVEE